MTVIIPRPKPDLMESCRHEPASISKIPKAVLSEPASTLLHDEPHRSSRASIAHASGRDDWSHNWARSAENPETYAGPWRRLGDHGLPLARPAFVNTPSRYTAASEPACEVLTLADVKPLQPPTSLQNILDPDAGHSHAATHAQATQFIQMQSNAPQTGVRDCRATKGKSQFPELWEAQGDHLGSSVGKSAAE